MGKKLSKKELARFKKEWAAFMALYFIEIPKTSAFGRGNHTHRCQTRWGQFHVHACFDEHAPTVFGCFPVRDKLPTDEDTFSPAKISGKWNSHHDNVNHTMIDWAARANYAQMRKPTEDELIHEWRDVENNEWERRDAFAKNLSANFPEIFARREDQELASHPLWDMPMRGEMVDLGAPIAMLMCGKGSWVAQMRPSSNLEAAKEVARLMTLGNEVSAYVSGDDVVLGRKARLRIMAQRILEDTHP